MNKEKDKCDEIQMTVKYDFITWITYISYNFSDHVSIQLPILSHAFD